MASESVTILIEAEDNATAVIEKTDKGLTDMTDRANRNFKTATDSVRGFGDANSYATEAVVQGLGQQKDAHLAGWEAQKRYSKAFDEFGGKIEGVTDNVKTFAIASYDVRDALKDELDELKSMGESLSDVAKRTDELAAKTQSWIVKLKGVAGAATAIVTTFLGAVAVGKRIGDWIFQTKQFEEGLKADADALAKVNAGNLNRDTTVIDRQIELAKLQGKSTNEIREGKGGIADQLIDAGLLVEERKAEKKAIDLNRTALKSEVMEAQVLLDSAIARKEALGAIYDSMSDEVIAHEAAVEAVKAQKQATEDLAQAQFDMFNEYARMADEKNKADEKALKQANEDAVEFMDNMAKMHDDQNKRDEKQREKEEKDAFDLFNNLAQSYSDIDKQERADADKAEKEKIAQAKKALAAKAKLSKAEQSTPDLQATESRLLGGRSADPQEKMVISLQQIEAYMAAEQKKLDDMVTALKAATTAVTIIN